MKRILSILLLILLLSMFPDICLGVNNNVVYATTVFSNYFTTTFTASSQNIGTATVGLKTGFDFISNDSSYYNWELALIGATLSAQVYSNANGDDIKKILYRLGYDTVKVWSDSSYNRPGVCFGYKNLDGKKNIFTAVVRGTDGGLDIWTDIGDGLYTMFSESEQRIRNKMLSFMEEATGKTLNQLKNEDNYFFFTGHSLGGAVANNLSIDEALLEFVNSNKGRIYTYTFESPHTCINLLWRNPEEMSNAFNFKVDGDAVTNIPSWMGSTTYGKDIFIKVDNLDNHLYKKLFPKSKADDVNGACSIYWHGDCYGLHDIFLSLIYIMGKAQTDGYDIKSALNPSENTEWGEAYKEFVSEKEYFTITNQERGVDDDSATYYFQDSYYFRDMDVNGIPELIIEIGDEGLARGYVFSYDGSSVVYCGSIYSGITVDDYPGIVTYITTYPWEMKDEDAQKYDEIIETYYFVIEDYTVVKKLVQREVIPIGASFSEREIEYQDPGEVELLSALIGVIRGGTRMPFSEVSQMSWEEFLEFY